MLFLPSLKLFFSNIRFYFVIAIEVSISFIFFLMVLGYRNIDQNTSAALLSSNHTNIIFYMQDPLLSYEAHPRELVLDILETPFVAENMTFGTAIDANGNLYQLICYGENTALHFPLATKAGNWFSVSEESNAASCVVIGQKDTFPIGETQTLEYALPDGSSCSVAFTATGWLGTSSFVPDFLYSSNQLTASEWMSKWDSVELDSTIILFSNPTIAKNLYAINDNKLLFFDESYSDSQLHEISNALKNEAWTCTYNELLHNTKNETDIYVYAYTPLAICFLIMGLIGGFCSLFLTLSKNKKLYSVFLLCGMKHADCFKVQFIIYSLLTICTSFLTYFLYYILHYFQIVPTYEYTFLQLLLPYLICTFVFSAILAALSIPVVYGKKNVLSHSEVSV